MYQAISQQRVTTKLQAVVTNPVSIKSIIFHLQTDDPAFLSNIRFLNNLIDWIQKEYPQQMSKTPSQYLPNLIEKVITETKAIILNNYILNFKFSNSKDDLATIKLFVNKLFSINPQTIPSINNLKYNTNLYAEFAKSYDVYLDHPTLSQNEKLIKLLLHIDVKDTLKVRSNILSASISKYSAPLVYGKSVNLLDKDYSEFESRYK